jgi:predicted nuclease of predicted toxin-antitoxin system
MVTYPLLLADENFSREASTHLQNLGYDLITLTDLGLAQIGMPDPEVLKKATALNRCVITFNRLDFIKLHKASNQHAGIIVCTYNPDNKQLAQKIHQSIQESKTLHTRLIRIYRD